MKNETILGISFIIFSTIFVYFLSFILIMAHADETTTKSSSSLMADKFFEDNPDSHSNWWNDKFYETSVPDDDDNDPYDDNDINFDNNNDNNNGEQQKNFHQKHLKCFKQMLKLYGKIANQFNKLFRMSMERNPHKEFDIRLSLKLYELNDFNDYIRQFEMIHKEFLLELDDPDSVAKINNNDQKSKSNQPKFCDRIKQIEYRFQNLLHRTIIEPKKSSYEKLRSFSSLLVINRHYLINYLTPTVAFLVQISLLLYYNTITIRKCIGLIIFNLIFTGSLMKYYLEKQIEHERLIYSDYNPDLITLIVQYFMTIFTYMMTEFIQKLQPQLQQLFEQITIDSWNPFIFIRNFCILMFSIFLLFQMIPYIFNFFVNIIHILFDHHHHHHHHHRQQQPMNSHRMNQKEITNSNGNDQPPTIVYNFNNSTIGTIECLDSQRLKSSSSSPLILSPKLESTKTTNAELPSDNEEYYSADENS
uniref:Uncharacterized protein LOC113795143 n=1 Tax=Dermatophagoides pteronyssinus TaxID=6956 RepID=A0A6P6Y754_DERPT|nr:uncharacterized protein LOC113795143 [Dermatophagoides pteronyssinus]